MAAYSDIIATLGGATSNSYVTGVTADQFAELQSWNDVWLGKSESERTIALLQAAKWLDTIDYGGTRCNPSTDCLLYTSPSPRDSDSSRMPSSA